MKKEQFTPLLRRATLLLSFAGFPFLSVAQCSFTISTAVVNTTCYNATTGAITVSVAGGTSPYQYQLAEAGAGAWQTSNVFPALAANIYPVSVKDATGCISTVYAAVTQPAQIVVGYTAADPTCSGSSNGSITTTVTGGTAPYSYAWTKNGSAYATTAQLTGLSAGNYNLVVTDNNGCTATPVITSQVKPVSLTGFNEDIIANGTSAASSVTTTGLDGSSGNVLYASGYNNTSTTGSAGLPANGSITSVQNASRLYQLASYSSSNALALRSATDASNGGATSGTLSFATQNQSPYASLYVVGTTGNGTGTVNYTVNYSDGSSSSGSMTFPDWFLAPATASSQRALGSLDRVNRSSPYAFDGSTNFNLFENPITIDPSNQSKIINSVAFSWNSSSNARPNIFAITGYTSTTVIRINDGPASSVAPAVAVTSDAISNKFCSGQSVTFTAIPANGGAAPTYQWKLNGTNVSGATNATYTNASLANNSQVSVVMTATAGLTCLTTTTATSSAVTMTTGVVTAAVSIAASTASICSGATVNFTATPTNGGTNPSYQWKVNGSAVSGATNATYSSSSLANNDNVTAVMTSSIGCATGSPATGSAVTMAVTPMLTPTVTVTSNPAAPRANAAVLFTAVATNGGTTPAYQWYRNGTAIALATSSTYNVSSAVVRDAYSVKLTSNYGCKTAPAAMSNYMTVGSPLAVTMEWCTLTEKDDEVLLQWKTSDEYDNKQFIVQRSLSGTAGYVNVGTVPSQSLKGGLYNYTDRPGVSGTYLYRIADEAVDGTITYSKIMSAVIKSAPQVSVAVQGNNWIINSEQEYNYYLSDMEGRVLQHGRGNGITLLAQPAAAGIYILKTVCNGEMINRKLVKCTDK
ncbi:hypothetical protein ACTHGU_10400 [Chitinophagaceae bacterium MMS25-I14]